jgi:hypothetical protein
VTEADLMSVLAATVKARDEVWFMGQLRVVQRVENATPVDGQITWTLKDWGAPVQVSAIKKVAIRRG